MFFEGFVALFMLARHKKASQSFSEHLEKFNAGMRGVTNPLSKFNVRKD